MRLFSDLVVWGASPCNSSVVGYIFIYPAITPSVSIMETIPLPLYFPYMWATEIIISCRWYIPLWSIIIPHLSITFPWYSDLTGHRRFSSSSQPGPLTSASAWRVCWAAAPKAMHPRRMSRSRSAFIKELYCKGIWGIDALWMDEEMYQKNWETLNIFS